MGKSIFSQLSRIQRELKAPKGQYNNFGKYKYRSCEDILEAVKPLLKDTILTITDSVEYIGNRYYIKANAILSDGENNIIITAYAREAESKKGMDESQVTGAASSYARKYALNGLFCIDDTKDADTTNVGQNNGTNVQPNGQKSGYPRDVYGVCPYCDSWLHYSEKKSLLYCGLFLEDKSKKCEYKPVNMPKKELNILPESIRSGQDAKKKAREYYFKISQKTQGDLPVFEG